MIEVRLDLADLQRMLDPQLLRQAQREALQNTRGKTATLISKTVRTRYNITAGQIAQRLKMGFKDATKAEATLTWIGERISLINFGAKFKVIRTSRGKRQGATYSMLKGKGRVLAPGGFIAAGKGGNIQVFQRQSAHQRSRLPLKKMTGPAIPQMVSGQDVMQAAQYFVSIDYPEQLRAKIERRLEQLSRK